MIRGEAKTVEKKFSTWSEGEKEVLLSYLQKKFFLVRKTTFIQAILGTIVACLFILGGAREYINDAVSSEMSSLIASGAHEELAQLQEKARNDVANINAISTSAKQSMLDIDTMERSLKTGNFVTRTISVESLNLVDAAGHVRLSLYTDKSDSPDIDFLSGDGTRLLRVGTDGEQGYGLFISNADGDERLAMSLQTCLCATISLSDSKGDQRLVLDVPGHADTSEDTPNLYLENRNGVILSEAYEASDSHSGAFFVTDNKGNVSYSLPSSLPP